MDSNVRREAIREYVKKKHQGQTKLVCKTRIRYPETAEREYQRVTNAYVRLLSKTLAEQLVPSIRKIAKEELPPDYYRHDSQDGLMWGLVDAFAKCSEELEQNLSRFGLYRRISEMAALTVKLSIKEWKRAVKETVVIDLLDDYYAGEFYKMALEAWTRQNVDLIKTIPQESLGRMRDIVLDGYREGRTTTNIVKAILREYSTTRRHAQLLARDQIAKLNGEIAQKQQQDAGVEEYEWSDSRDERVRTRHHALNGKRFRWNDPPVVDERTGRRCHPGGDYQCRCVALPVFDIDTLDL